MKFGKQFDLYKIPEWFEYYFDYEGIKLMLKFLDIRPIKAKKLKTLQMVKKNLRCQLMHINQKNQN